MKWKNQILLWIAISGFLAASVTSCIQKSSAALQEELSGDDSIAISALVLYPDTVRRSIFEVCKYPKAIHEIARLQEKTSDDFADLIKDYPQDEQEEIWDLTRYPGLINKIAIEQKDNSYLNDYPDDIHSTAIKYNTSHLDLMQKVNELQSESEKRFNDIIADYPKETQEAFREIVEMPEVLTILDEHDDMTKRVGDLYEKDPDLVIQTADSLNKVIVRQNAENLELWKQQVNSDPAVSQDLTDAAGEYAAGNGYDEEEYTSAPSYYYVHEYTWYPYPYWFGYPYWYPYDYWYPYPYWYDWGFYYGPGNSIVVIGMPSYYFTYWYFYYPVHYYHHPHLATAYVNYYYGPHRMGNDHNAVIVGRWVDENRKYLPPDFETNPNGREEAIKQLGQFEDDYQKSQGIAGGTSKESYFNEHKTSYPALSEKSPGKIEKQQPGLIQHGDQQPPVKQPRVKMQKEQQQTQQQPPEQMRQQQGAASKGNYNYERVSPAQEYHRNVWDQQRQKPRRQPATGGKKRGGGG